MALSDATKTIHDPSILVLHRSALHAPLALFEPSPGQHVRGWTKLSCRRCELVDQAIAARRITLPELLNPPGCSNWQSELHLGLQISGRPGVATGRNRIKPSASRFAPNEPQSDQETGRDVFFLLRIDLVRCGTNQQKLRIRIQNDSYHDSYILDDSGLISFLAAQHLVFLIRVSAVAATQGRRFLGPRTRQGSRQSNVAIVTVPFSMPLCVT